MPTQTPNKYFMQTHEPRLVDLNAQVRNDGTISYGGASYCPFTVTVPASNVLLFTTKRTVPIYTADLTNTSRVGSANGTGVTKTYNIDACPMIDNTVGLLGASKYSTFDTIVSTPAVTSGIMSFYLQFYGTILTSLGVVASHTGVTLTLVTHANASNFTTGQKVTAYSTNAYGVPTFSLTVVSANSSTGVVTFTSTVPSIDGYYLFPATTLYANLSVTTSTGLMS